MTTLLQFPILLGLPRPPLDGSPSDRVPVMLIKDGANRQWSELPFQDFNFSECKVNDYSPITVNSYPARNT